MLFQGAYVNPDILLSFLYFFYFTHRTNNNSVTVMTGEDLNAEVEIHESVRLTLI